MPDAVAIFGDVALYEKKNTQGLKESPNLANSLGYVLKRRLQGGYWSEGVRVGRLCISLAHRVETPFLKMELDFKRMFQAAFYK